MADTSYGVNHALAVKLWSKKLFVEVLQECIAAKFIGETPGSLFQIKDEMSKTAGDKVTFGLRMQLSGRGTTGDNTQQDQEEQLVTYSDSLIIDQQRNAVRSGGKMSEQRVTFDVREEAKSGLVDWWADRIDTALFNQIGGNTAQSDTAYTGMQATLGPDSDHHLIAGAQANEQSLNSGHTFDLALIDTAVERARTISPGLRPVKAAGDEYWVMFIHPYVVTDMRKNTNTAQWYDIQKAALTGGNGNKNPIFTGALGMYNNTILHMDKRVPLGINASTGLAIATVRRGIFCGAQSGVVGFGRDYNNVTQFKWVEELFDYENKLGVCAGLVWGAKKTQFNSTDFGAITVATYAAAH